MVNEQIDSMVISRTYIETALDSRLYTAFETRSSVFVVSETLVITAKLKPSLGVPSPGGLFVVPECNAGVKWDIFWKSAR